MRGLLHDVGIGRVEPQGRGWEAVGHKVDPQKLYGLEGVGDPDGSGGYRGWSRRLAQRIADRQGSLEYANLATRGWTTREILDGQLRPALALRPDLATVFSGTNDLVSRQLDVRAVTRDPKNAELPAGVQAVAPEAIHAALRGVRELFVHPRAAKNEAGS